MSHEKIWDAEWPEESLENVSCCPVCGSENNELLMSSLVDNAFFVAPGKWHLYECGYCHSGYLNPRPDESSIHKAYGTYYTHEAPSTAESVGASPGLIRKLLKALANGYYNYHHGMRREPSIKLGASLLLLYPKFSKSAKTKFRYLPTPKPCQKLLDVGCGNGDYLALASEAGWVVKGVEPDSKALEVARARGFEVVQGSLDEIVDSGELFDAITMSHVIEHVHEPVDFVKLAHRCLKPGGILYIDTPNIRSVGAKRFGKSWRGLEAPRHLVILSKVGLTLLLEEVGFGKLQFLSRWEVRANIALKSYRIELGKSPYDTYPKRLPLEEMICSRLPRRSGEEEFLTVIARKV